MRVLGPTIPLSFSAAAVPDGVVGHAREQRRDVQCTYWQLRISMLSCTGVADPRGHCAQQLWAAPAPGFQAQALVLLLCPYPKDAPRVRAAGSSRADCWWLFMNPWALPASPASSLSDLYMRILCVSKSPHCLEKSFGNGLSKQSIE